MTDFKECFAKWRDDLGKVGGWDNELRMVPAGGVRKIIEDGERAAAEIERLRAALKPFAVEVEMLAIHGALHPPERLLMYASDGSGTFLGISISTLYDARRVYEQSGEQK